MKQCPCGLYPRKLDIFPSNTSKWAYAAGSCCNGWMIEFRTKNYPQDSQECMELAIAEWNATQRDEVSTALEEAIQTEPDQETGSQAINRSDSLVLRAQKLEEEGHTDQALDFLYDSVDDLMREGEFSRLNTILESSAVEELSTDILIGVLTATLPVRRRLQSRPQFFDKVKQVLRNRDEYEEGLLTGL